MKQERQVPEVKEDTPGNPVKPAQVVKGGRMGPRVKGVRRVTLVHRVP